MTTSSRIRETFPACPPRRTGHDEQYNPWTRISDGSEIRKHDGVIVSVGECSVSTTQVEFSDGTMAPITMNVFTKDDTAHLALEEARAFAHAILAQVDLAEAHR